MITFFLFLFAPAKIQQIKLESKSDCHFKSNKWFTDSAHQEMLHCNVVVMKVINEKNGIFSFYLHNMNKNFNESHFHYSGLNASIKSVNNQLK